MLKYCLIIMQSQGNCKEGEEAMLIKIYDFQLRNKTTERH